jgi:cytidylate kinase
MGNTTFGPLVTVSATYGAGGSVIAPRLAEEFGVPFIDRLISADFSQDAAAELRSQEGLCEGEQEASPAGRFLSYFARAASVGAMMAPDPLLEDDDSIRTRTESALIDVKDGAPGVVLGRAGAIVLASRPRAYHVRLDGAAERRVAWAATYENLGLEAARRRQAETDKTRTMFVKRLYRVDPSNPGLYHLILDPTVLGLDRATQILVGAVRAYFEANPE